MRHRQQLNAPTICDWRFMAQHPHTYRLVHRLISTTPNIPSSSAITSYFACSMINAIFFEFTQFLIRLSSVRASFAVSLDDDLFVRKYWVILYSFRCVYFAFFATSLQDYTEGSQWRSCVHIKFQMDWHASQWCSAGHHLFITSLHNCRHNLSHSGIAPLCFEFVLRIIPFKIGYSFSFLPSFTWIM